jgi:GntR family transcriptional repressor for pyruvate dehydrogenase complex
MNLRKPSLARAVEENLLQRMLGGEFTPGDRLPSELELCESLGVSRSVVREALKRLQRTGVVRTVHGSGGGSFVQSPDMSVLTEQLHLYLQLEGVTIGQLMEARMILAPPMAALAAERASQEDIEELERIWNAGGEGPESNRLPGELIEAFHLKLASMTRNPALEAAARPLIQLVTTAFTPAASRRALAGEPSILTLQWGVLDAVKKRNPEMARRRMLELMEAAYARLRTDENDFGRSIRPSGR